jgi:hypothetical protein
MFGLRWNTLPGSEVALIWVSRPHFAGPAGADGVQIWASQL